MRFTPGDLLPPFVADSNVRPRFDLDLLAGERLLLVFLGSAGLAFGQRLRDDLLAAQRPLWELGIRLCIVSADPADRDEGRLSGFVPPSIVFWDADRAIYRLFGMEVAPADGAARPSLRVGAAIIAENRRLKGFLPAQPLDTFAVRLRDAVHEIPPRTLGRPAPRHAPVLQIPDVFDADLCRRLVAAYEADGGGDSGFMRDDGEVTRGLIDGRGKRRRDCYLSDPALCGEIRGAFERRVLPEIAKAFQFRVACIERYLVACYDGSDAGFFMVHRDNNTHATAHRRFAVSVNLNGGEFEGGALRFLEYGLDTYSPGTGEALVFSGSLLHEAMRVTKGRRFVFLTFLHDAAAEALRRRNLGTLDQSGPRTVTAAE
ncbi:MAG: hypothetical protein GC201_03755 [Alphaproteobacteria bacterium]|nr:hypothetical protein [Alphaproteobacteria bacterium]